MRIVLVASPFISVPPTHYGGTELFIAHLAEGLNRRGIETVVYCNGESTVKRNETIVLSTSRVAAIQPKHPAC